MISPCHCLLLVGPFRWMWACDYWRKEIHTYIHVIMFFSRGKRKHSGYKAREQMVPICLAREFRGGGQNGTQLLDAPSVRLRFISLIIKILLDLFVPLEFVPTSAERITKIENEVHMHAWDEVGGVLLMTIADRSWRHCQ